MLVGYLWHIYGPENFSSIQLVSILAVLPVVSAGGRRAPEMVVIIIVGLLSLSELGIY